MKMRARMKNSAWMMIMLMGVVLAGPVMAAQWMALDTRQMSYFGATHVMEITYADFAASTDTNTAMTITNAIPAKTAVTCIGMVLDQAFDVGTTNYTGSVLMKVGDGSDDDLFLASTELASDGTEVLVKYSPPHAGTITVTPQTQTVQINPVLTLGTQTVQVAPVLTLQRDGANVTNVTVATTGVAVCTNVTVATTALAVCTNATATFASAELGRKLYAATGNMVFTFTPNADESLSQNTAGKVRVFFKLIEPKK